MPSWPLSMEMWSKGVTSSVEEGLCVCGGGDGVCLRDEAGVGGLLFPDWLGFETFAVPCLSGCGRGPGRMREAGG